MKKVHQTERITAITNARIFDGERVINDQTVVINGASISAPVAQCQPEQPSSMLRARP